MRSHILRQNQAKIFKTNNHPIFAVVWMYRVRGLKLQFLLQKGTLWIHGCSGKKKPHLKCY